MDIKKQVGGILEKVGKTYITYSKMHQELVLSDLTDYISQIHYLYEQAGWKPVKAGVEGLTVNPYTRDDSEMEHIRYTAFEEGCESQQVFTIQQAGEDGLLEYPELYIDAENGTVDIFKALKAQKALDDKRLNETIDMYTLPIRNAQNDLSKTIAREKMQLAEKIFEGFENLFMGIPKDDKPRESIILINKDSYRIFKSKTLEELK